MYIEECGSMRKFCLVVSLLFLLTGCGGKKNEITQNESVELPQEEQKIEVPSEPVETPPAIEEVLPKEDTSTLSNKKIGWYFSRGKDHAKPTFGKDLTVPADKYNSIYLFPGDEKIIYLTLVQSGFYKSNILYYRSIFRKRGRIST